MEAEAEDFSKSMTGFFATRAFPRGGNRTNRGSVGNGFTSGCGGSGNGGGLHWIRRGFVTLAGFSALAGFGDLTAFGALAAFEAFAFGTLAVLGALTSTASSAFAPEAFGAATDAFCDAGFAVLFARELRGAGSARKPRNEASASSAASLTRMWIEATNESINC